MWSEEESHVGFMKCHVQKRFQSDVMSTANQFIDPNVYLSTILRFLKNVSLKKQKLISDNTAKVAIN